MSRADIFDFYHSAPRDLGDSFVVGPGGTFGGIFSLPTPKLGGFVYGVSLPDAAIGETYDFAYDPRAVGSLLEVCGWLSGPDDPLFDVCWEAVVEDRAHDVDEDDLLLAMRRDDVGAASWEAQRLRGLLAARFGFQAVKMSDEYGTSVLVLPGATFYRVR